MISLVTVNYYRDAIFTFIIFQSFLVAANKWSEMIHLVAGQNYLYKANISLDGICGKSIKLEAFVDKTIFTSDQTGKN